MQARPPRTHVFIIDGTMSRLEDGHETNAGLIYKLVSEVGPRADQTVGYHPGVQGSGWTKWLTVAAGMTINHSICAGYAALCSRYVPGDRIMLFGYSRGAYAVRSLAGMIGRIGLLRRQHATERRVMRAFRHYEAANGGGAAAVFSERFCRQQVPIEFLGVFDTVSALGLPYPVLSRLAPMATHFHDDTLGGNIRHAAQALALDETRSAYAPLLWSDWPETAERVEQVWFPGAHSDVGGQLGGYPAARPLGNIPLVWMLERAALCGLQMAPDWRERLPCDPGAPMRGCWRGNAALFLSRAPRTAGHMPGEAVHESAAARAAARPRYVPRARWRTPSPARQ